MGCPKSAQGSAHLLWRLPYLFRFLQDDVDLVRRQLLCAALRDARGVCNLPQHRIVYLAEKLRQRRRQPDFPDEGGELLDAFQGDLECRLVVCFLTVHVEDVAGEARVLLAGGRGEMAVKRRLDGGEAAAVVAVRTRQGDGRSGTCVEQI